MKSRVRAMYGLLALVMLLLPPSAWTQTNADYTAVPPFVSSVATPNVLIILDNSGSMGRRANCTLSSGLSSGGYDACPTFDETFRYGGLFDPMQCYLYDPADTRFEPVSGKKASINAKCGSTEWDGNLLNWVTLRRLDMAKIALIGGVCAVSRNATGNCPPTGNPSMVTIKGHDLKAEPSGSQISTSRLPVGSGVNQSDGRVPDSIETGTTGIRFHLFGTNGGAPGPLMGWFCTDNDATLPSASASACNAGDSDGYAEQGFKIAVALPSEPQGVIQNTGNRVRFGLMEYKGDDGGQVMVPIGSFQYRKLNVASVTTFSNNTTAMIKAIEDTFNEGNTPMAETFYEATRYIGQVNSSLFTSSYVYPIAFSPGVGLGSAGAGGMGAGEVKDLTGTETCPSGSGYITDACGRDPFFFGSAHVPAWASPSAQVPCCKTYVVIFTDGDSQQDTKVPSFLQDFAHSLHGVHCSGNDTSSPTAPINSTCNMHPLTPPNIMMKEHRTDYANSGSHYLDDVAYWAHISDLRAPTVTAQVPGSGTVNTVWSGGRDLPGLQNITTYTFFAFSQMLNREFLMQTARQGGFEDKNGNGIPDNGLGVPSPCDEVDLSKPCEYDAIINLTGAPGRDNVPDTFFESSDVDFMQERLSAVIDQILAKSSSGTSISVLATSASGEGAIYQAYFFTNEIGKSGADVKWSGYTHALFIDAFGNFREDTVKDGVLDYTQDRIVTTRYDDNQASPTYQKVLVDKYEDINGDGVADSTTPTIQGADLKSIIPIWEAGKELALMSSASRRILTWVDGNNDGIVDPSEQIEFSTANCMTLKDYLRYAGDTCGGSSNAMNLINFIRGDEVTGLRTRMLEVPVGSGTYSVWKLGDPIHSTPTIVGAPRERYDLIYGDPTYNTFYRQYRNRRQVAYVGANDGMLHAFNAGYYHKGDDPTTSSVIEHGWFTRNPTDNSSGSKLGGELWAMIPQELLPQLQWLARPDYAHVYYVDLKPKVSDVRIFAPDADHPDGWGTILIGGFRMGGSCGNCMAGAGASPMTATIGGVPRTFYSAYFVLDITNPEVDPKLLWVFTDSGLGLTTSYPAVARVNPMDKPSTDKTNEKWFAIFGSGPNGYQADLPIPPLPGQPQTSKLYIVDLAAGPGTANTNVTAMSVGTWRSFVGHIITVDKDLDYRVDAAYMGRTIHDDTLPWRGKMYRLTTDGCATAPCSPNTWGIIDGGSRSPTEIIDTFYDAVAGTTVEVGPITAAPTATIDDSDKVWVFFGTGRYLANTDKVDNSQQHLYGIKDSVLSGSCTQTSMTSCHDDDLVDTTNAIVCLVCSSGTNQVTDPANTGVTTFNGTGTTSMIGLVASKAGWHVALPTSSGINAAERSVVNPTLIGGTVFFPTFVPTNDFCSPNGISYLYALFYKTGTAAMAPVIGATAVGGNVNISTKVSLGIGLASAMSVQIGSQGSGSQGLGSGGGGCSGGMTGAIQMSTGAASKPCTSAGDYYSRFVSWVHQRD
ncbi:MAG: hypothetical protein JSS39_05440 [Nitrospira sp.]|nr:hypothetical protein [Nitrospira sp.]